MARLLDALFDESSPLHSSATHAPTRFQTLDRLSKQTDRLTMGDWGDAALDEPKRLLPDIRVVVDAIGGVAEKPRLVLFDLGDPHPGVGALEPFAPLNDEWGDLLSAMRQIAHLNTVLMREDASLGRWDEVARRVQLGRAIAGHAATLPILITHLSADAIDFNAIREAAWCVDEFDAPVGAIDAVLAEASAPAQYDESGVNALRGEGLAILDSLHSLYNGQQAAWSVVFLPTYREVRRNVERFFADAEAWWIADPTTRGPAPDAGAYASGGPLRRFDPTDVFLPSLRAADACAMTATRRAAYVFMLHVERYEREHGALPDNLDRVSESAATDPISGGRFRFALSAESPGYSIGAPAEATHIPPAAHDLTPRRRDIPKDPLTDTAGD